MSSVSSLSVHTHVLAMKIGIFPASGGLGASTYTHLLKIVDPADVTLISRHPNKISSKHKAAGVTCIQAGWSTTAEAYDHVFDGIHCLFLISYPSFEFERRVDVSRISPHYRLSWLKLPWTRPLRRIKVSPHSYRRRPQIRRSPHLL